MVFVGEYGDTDYEGLFGGAHKTLILKGIGNGARKLHTSRTYPLEHVISYDSPNVVQVEGCDGNEITSSLGKLGVFKD